MKKLGLNICLLFLMVNLGQGQTFQEWFKQRRTQKEYLITQILANQSYLELLCKGYSLFNTGMDLISEQKRGELNLHTLFFSHLTQVSPHVVRQANLERSVALQLQLLNVQKRVNVLAGSPMLRSDERDYSMMLASRIVASSYAALEEMLALNQKNTYAMSDKERMDFLQLSHRQLEKQEQSLRGLEQELFLLIKHRSLAQKELPFLKSLQP